MRVLVTGGAGSIGSGVVDALVKRGDQVRVADVNEEGLHYTKLKHPDVDVRLCDVAGEDLTAAAKGVEAIVHCAANKHVNLVESAPNTSRATNEHGTLNVLSCLQHGEVDRVVFLSTDKALDPGCEMGRQKAKCELWTLQFGGSVVRFGNVIGSRGSLVPSVIRYKELGRPIELTHGAMTRFFMTTDEAVGLILRALDDNGNRIYVPDVLRSAQIGDFVTICRDYFAPGHPIVERGLRDGERMHEFAVTPDGETVRSDDLRYIMNQSTIEQFIGGLYPNARRVMVKQT